MRDVDIAVWKQKDSLIYTYDWGSVDNGTDTHDYSCIDDGTVYIIEQA